jgi:hypothetical protein
MLQTYDDIDMCLCFVRDCIQRRNGVHAQHFAAVLRGEVSELLQSLGTPTSLVLLECMCTRASDGARH